MNVYQGLFNTTDINADNIFAENAIFNNVTLLGDIKTDLTPLKVVITNVNQELNTITYTALNLPNTIVSRDSNGDIIVKWTFLLYIILNLIQNLNLILPQMD